MSTDYIRTKNISKFYKDVCAVSDMSLSVRKGEIYGFLGLNGAGKTTTIRMLLGIIRPTSGMAYIKGKKVSADSPKLLQNIGALVETPYSYPELTVWENLEMFRRLHFLRDVKVVNKIIDKLQLNQYINRKAKNLSHGNKQRLGLAKALIHQPEILILDEPTNGLDPAGIYEIREMLSNLAKNRGVTVFISSHILGEVSRFATRIGIIHQGKLIQEVTSSQLEALCNKRLVVSSNNNSKAFSILSDRGYQVETNSKKQLEIRDENAMAHPDTVAAIMVNAGCSPILLKIEEEDLETYFLRTIGIKGDIE